MALLLVDQAVLAANLASQSSAGLIFFWEWFSDGNHDDGHGFMKQPHNYGKIHHAING